MMDEIAFDRHPEPLPGFMSATPWIVPQPMAAEWPDRPRVLVVGVAPTLTWSVARCLSRAGIRPTVLGSHRLSPLSLLSGCDYAATRDARWIGAELDPQLIEQLERACVRHAVDVILPVDAPSALLMTRYAAALSRARVTALPSEEVIELRDAWRFSRQLARLELPQPATELASGPDEVRRSSLRFPIVTKPIERSSGFGLRVHRDLHAFERALRAKPFGVGFPSIVQEFIPGRDVGFAFLARRGRLIAHAAFEQVEPGVRRFYEAPELRRHVQQLSAALGYHGVGEIDARYDPSRGEYRLLGMKPRFGNSILYAARAGMNFPEWLLQIDELGDGPGFCASRLEIRLSSYERALERSIHWSERAHSQVHRWLGG